MGSSKNLGAILVAPGIGVCITYNQRATISRTAHIIGLETTMAPSAKQW